MKNTKKKTKKTTKKIKKNHKKFNDNISPFPFRSCLFLKHVQVLARLGLGVPGPHLAQQSLHPEAGGRPGASVLFERRTAVRQRWLGPFAHRWRPGHAVLRRLFQLQPDLRQYAHQQFVHVVIDYHGRFDELAVVPGGHLFTHWIDKKLKKINKKWMCDIANQEIRRFFAVVFFFFINKTIQGKRRVSWLIDFNWLCVIK